MNIPATVEAVLETGFTNVFVSLNTEIDATTFEQVVCVRLVREELRCLQRATNGASLRRSVPTLVVPLLSSATRETQTAMNRRPQKSKQLPPVSIAASLRAKEPRVPLLLRIHWVTHSGGTRSTDLAIRSRMHRTKSVFCQTTNSCSGRRSLMDRAQLRFRNFTLCCTRMPHNVNAQTVWFTAPELAYSAASESRGATCDDSRRGTSGHLK